MLHAEYSGYLAIRTMAIQALRIRPTPSRAFDPTAATRAAAGTRPRRRSRRSSGDRRRATQPRRPQRACLRCLDRQGAVERGSGVAVSAATQRGIPSDENRCAASTWRPRAARRPAMTTAAPSGRATTTSRSAALRAVGARHARALDDEARAAARRPGGARPAAPRRRARRGGRAPTAPARLGGRAPGHRRARARGRGRRAAAPATT